MNTKKWFAFGLGAVVALGLGFGALNYANSASAAEGDVAISALVSTGDEDVEHPGGRRGGHRGGKFGGDGTFLAEALGVTVEELEAAKDAVRAQIEESDELTRADANALFAAELGITEEALDAAKDEAKAAALAAAVADGTITQEQADLIEARQAVKDAIDAKELAASVLGISVEALEAAKEDGTSRQDLLDAAGLTMETFRSAMEEAYQVALDQAVADGTITQEQADLVEDAPFGRGGKFGKGGRGGNRGFGGQRGQGFDGGAPVGTDA